ncbi:hypothetical protein [Nostoc phage A1]|nr:hypothetical protein [Nostoc phage A1]
MNEPMDTIKIRDDIINRFESCIKKFPHVKERLIKNYFEQCFLHEENARILKLIVTIEKNGIMDFEVYSTVVKEYVDFLPGLEDAMNHSLMNNRVPILISFFPNENYELAFPVSIES